MRMHSTNLAKIAQNDGRKCTTSRGFKLQCSHNCHLKGTFSFSCL